MTPFVINSPRKEILIKANRIAMETGSPSSHDLQAAKKIGRGICLVTTALMNRGAKIIPRSIAAAKGAAGGGRWGGEAARGSQILVLLAGQSRLLGGMLPEPFPTSGMRGWRGARRWHPWVSWVGGPTLT